MSAWEPEERDDAEYSLKWRFLDQSSSFAAGVRAGIVYERMERREATIVATLPLNDEEEFRNLSNSFGYRLALSELSDFWAEMTFSRIPE